MSHITRDSNNCEPRLLGVVMAQLDPFADRVFIGPEPARHRLIDDDHSRALGGALVVELASLAQRNSHSPKIIRASHAVSRARLMLRAGIGPPFDGEPAPRVSAADGQMANAAYRYDARHRAHLL